MQVSWRQFGGDASPASMEIDENYATRITPDDGDIATSVAKLIVDLQHEERGWSGYDGGDGPIVEILSPDAMKGVFFVAMSRNNRRGVLGTMGYRVHQASDEERDEHDRAVRRMTAPEDVEKAYVFMGNRYGHEVRLPYFVGEFDRATTDRIEAECEAIQTRYENAILHDLGCPVFCKVSGKTGVLIDCVDGLVPELDEIAAFEREHGLVIQPAVGSDGQSYGACFLPFERLDEAWTISKALREAMSRQAAPSHG